MGLVGGRSAGAVHLVDDPLRWDREPTADPQVVALPALWWPPPDGVPDAPVGFLLQGLPEAGGAVTLAPVVADVDLDLVRDGEPVELDGDAGTVRFADVTETPVVTAFLERPDGRILLLQRSERVGSFRGRWAAVSGFLEDPTPVDQARREVREETGLGNADVTLAAEGRPVYVRDGDRIWVVHPFRFRVDRTSVTLDWEHTGFDWVDPAELRRRPTVPKLDRAWEAVAPVPRPKG